MKKIQRPLAGWSSGPELRPWSLAVWLAVCLGASLSAGCRSTGKVHSDEFASVELHGHPIEQVRDVTAQVFHDHGYKVTQKGWTSLVFEKEGSTMNNLAYGNWMGSGIGLRVKATIHDLSPGECRLECEAFLVRNRDEPVEDEIKVSKLHRRPYQKLLDEVARRLSSEAAMPK